MVEKMEIGPAGAFDECESIEAIVDELLNYDLNPAYEIATEETAGTHRHDAAHFAEVGEVIAGIKARPINPEFTFKARRNEIRRLGNGKARAKSCGSPSWCRIGQAGCLKKIKPVILGSSPKRMTVKGLSERDTGAIYRRGFSAEGKALLQQALPSAEEGKRRAWGLRGKLAGCGFMRLARAFHFLMAPAANAAPMPLLRHPPAGLQITANLRIPTTSALVLVVNFVSYQRQEATTTPNQVACDVGQEQKLFAKSAPYPGFRFVSKSMGEWLPSFAVPGAAPGANRRAGSTRRHRATLAPSWRRR